MASVLSDASSNLNSDSDEYTEGLSKTRNEKSKKRRRIGTSTEIKSEDPQPSLSFQSMLDVLLDESKAGDALSSFEDTIEDLLPQLLEAKQTFLEEHAEEDLSGQFILPLSRDTEQTFRKHINIESASDTMASKIARRKALLHSGYLRRQVLSPTKPSNGQSLSTLPPIRTPGTANAQTIDALYSIKTTPYEQSFLSRLNGVHNARTPTLLAVDWESRTPWMDLMSDIREHHTLRHPNCDEVKETMAPITYASLCQAQLPQIHDLLSLSFWPGIDVSDSLQYSPERCTVIAMYKSLVVGAAFLSSPQETYITYLVVRAGWDNSQIATTMLYHLITLNPRKDITLHVSTNNPAMLLYNRFGFKAEEFVLGFYEDYLHPRSQASKNAFRLRLRQ